MLVRSGLLNCILESETCRRNGARETGTQLEGQESKKEGYKKRQIRNSQKYTSNLFTFRMSYDMHIIQDDIVC